MTIWPGPATVAAAGTGITAPSRRRRAPLVPCWRWSTVLRIRTVPCAAKPLRV